MGLIDWLILIAIAALAAGAVMLRRKKGGCCGSCNSGSCSRCPQSKATEQDKNQGDE